MRVSRNGWLVLVLALVTATGVVGWRALHHERTSDRIARQTAPKPATTDADVGESTTASLVPRAPVAGNASLGTGFPAPVQPLPPLNAPLAGILDGLEARARAGDARAACRLASELSRCSSVRRRLAMQQQRENWTAPPGIQATEEQIEWMARFDVALELDQKTCAGVPRERIRDYPRWLLDAARSGHAPSMRAFVLGPWIFDGGVIHQGAVLASYANEAEAMALALVELGDPVILSMLAMAYAQDVGFPTPLHEAVTADLITARAMLALAIERARAPARPTALPSPPGPTRALSVSVDQGGAHRKAFDRIDAQLTPAERTAADAELQRLRARVAPPQANPPPLADPLQRMGSFAVVWPGDCET